MFRFYLLSPSAAWLVLALPENLGLYNVSFQPIRTFSCLYFTFWLLCYSLNFLAFVSFQGGRCTANSPPCSALLIPFQYCDLIFCSLLFLLYLFVLLYLHSLFSVQFLTVLIEIVTDYIDTYRCEYLVFPSNHTDLIIIPSLFPPVSCSFTNCFFCHYWSLPRPLLALPNSVSFTKV